MSEQLVYTYSNSVHGNAFVRLYRFVVGGYGVVGKTRGVGGALEREMVALAKRGMAPEDGNPGPQYFYRREICAGEAQHLFGCIRRVKGRKHVGRYLCHILALSGEEVQDLWQEGCTLSPAGILLVLTMSDFWVKKWTGPAHWLERNAEPTWRVSEKDLQANRQPAWQRYTGHRETVKLTQESRFRESCMLAFPDGTPTQDMLRVLHEAHSLRRDLGWNTPVCTHVREDVTDMRSVMLLGIIGSDMQERARMMGIPALEVTEKLAERVAGNNTDAAMSSAPPPILQYRVTADVTRVELKESREKKTGNAYLELLRSVGRRVVGALAMMVAFTGRILGSAGKGAVGVVMLLVLLAGCYYVWQNLDMVKEKVESLVHKIKGREAGREREKAETAEEPTRPLSGEEERLLMGYIAPVRVGGRLPGPLKEILEGKLPVRLKFGKLTIFPLGDATGKDAPCYELRPEGVTVEIFPDGQPGCWQLVPTDADGTKGEAITLRAENGVLLGVTDGHGQPVAILLPVPVDGDQVGTVLLLPEWETKVTGDVTLDKKFVESFTLQLTPDCFEPTPQKIRFIRSDAMDALKGARGTAKFTFGNIVLPNAAAYNTFSLVIGDVNDAKEFQLTQEPTQGDESYIRCRLQGGSPFDFTMALVRAVVREANKLHGPRARGNKRPAASVGGLFYAVSEVIKNTGEKRTAAITGYVNMFNDEQFVEFCSRELSHMPMPHESVFDKEDDNQPRGRSPLSSRRGRIGNQPQKDSKAMQRFESFDYLGIRRTLCGWMENVAKREFAAEAERYEHDLEVPVRLRLRRVEAPGPGQLKWVFECNDAK